MCCVQAIPVRLAQGLITGYRVHIVDHSHSQKLELNSTSKPFLRLPELWTPSDHINLAVDARTSVGYNETLHLDVVHIRPLTRGMWRSLFVDMMLLQLCCYGSTSLQLVKVML